MRRSSRVEPRSEQDPTKERMGVEAGEKGGLARPALRPHHRHERTPVRPTPA